MLIKRILLLISFTVLIRSDLYHYIKHSDDKFATAYKEYEKTNLRFLSEINDDSDQCNLREKNDEYEFGFFPILLGKIFKEKDVII